MVLRQLKSELQCIRAAERGLGPDAHVAGLELSLRRWRLIHKFVHANPFPTRASKPRSRQWRDAAGHAHDIGEPELIDWVLLQSQVAANLERGIHDLRPRKSGPCHPLFEEWVRDRKRKALAVLRWAQAAEEAGSGAGWRVRGTPLAP